MNDPQKVLFIGSKQLGEKCLRILHELSPGKLCAAMTLDDRDDARSAFDAIETFCRSTETPLHVAQNRKESEKIIEELRPDRCIVIGWYWLISQRILDLVPNGFLGIHNSLLPKYRGGSPLVWSLINGEPEVGFSLFSFTQGMDEGDIWFQGKLQPGPEETVGELLVRLEDEVTNKLREHYLDILDGRLAPKAQEHALATYCAQRIPEDGRIDWRQSAHDVHNFIRAQSKPYPGAFTHVQSKRLTIWRAKKDTRIYFGTPGQVAQIRPDGVVVICGDNRALLLQDVEWEGVDQKAQEAIKTFETRFV